MRPTTAQQGNVISFDAVLHPETTFEHPDDVVSDPTLTRAEKQMAEPFRRVRP